HAGAGGETEAADSCKLLTRCNALAYSNVEGLHVSINGHGTIVVLDADPVAVAGSWARVDDGAIHDRQDRSEEHTSELQSRFDLVCRLLLEKKKKHKTTSK